MLTTRKFSLSLLAASVALPLLYGGLLALMAYWQNYRRGLPFDGMGAVLGLLVVLGLGASLCAASFLHFIAVSYRERATLSAIHVIQVSLFVVVLVAFGYLLQSILGINPFLR